MIRFYTSGESHGKAVVVTLHGLPANTPVNTDLINNELSRRQKGYGRGKRMAIEHDIVEIISGIRNNKTIGAPICMMIKNQDHKNTEHTVNNADITVNPEMTAPRPGHADLAGALKYGFSDIRNVLERASARETVGRVLAGALAKQFLQMFGMTFFSQTMCIGGICAQEFARSHPEIEQSPLRCPDPAREKSMIELINNMAEKGDSLGGITQVNAVGVCPGLGSYVHYDQRLDAQIALAMLSIPSVKGVEIGPAFENTQRSGSKVHDEILYTGNKGFFRATNRAGGIEGGISNGEDIIVRLAVKPIPSLKKPLRSVDLITKSPLLAQKQRADVCVVPAIGVIGEAMFALVIADLFVEKFGGDCFADCKANYNIYQKRLQNG